VDVLSMSGGAWNFGASILSFLFPMVLFVLVATSLYVLYTAPQEVPGHPAGTIDRPVSYTRIPRPPEASATAAVPAAASGAATTVEERPTAAADAPATAEDTVADTGTTGSTDGEAPGTGDGA
jgi:hypothetical protein